MTDEELTSLYRGYGWSPTIVDVDTDYEAVGSDRRLAQALDGAYSSIRSIQHDARADRSPSRPGWPMIIVRSPKGWGVPA